jgi:hypothetical protein
MNFVAGVNMECSAGDKDLQKATIQQRGTSLPQEIEGTGTG